MVSVVTSDSSKVILLSATENLPAAAVDASSMPLIDTEPSMGVCFSVSCLLASSVSHSVCGTAKSSFTYSSLFAMENSSALNSPLVSDISTCMFDTVRYSASVLSNCCIFLYRSDYLFTLHSRGSPFPAAWPYSLSG